MPNMHRLAAWIAAFASAVIQQAFAQQADTAQHAAQAQTVEAPASAGVVRLVERALAGGDDGAAAAGEVARLVEVDYALVFAAWEQAGTGRVADALARWLQLDLLRQAVVLVRGEVVSVVADQAGVVDWFHLDVRFAAGASIVRADARATEWLDDGALPVLEGSSRDAWLAEVLQRELERERQAHPGPRLWVFTVRQWSAMDTHPDADPGPPWTLLLRQWRTLPPAAAACAARLQPSPR